MQWILKSLDELTHETIVKSFKACALNIPVDGNEDEKIHCLKKNQPCHSGKSKINPFDVPYDVYEATPQFFTVDENSEKDIDIEV